MSKKEERRQKSSARRVLLGTEQADLIAELLDKLRESSCKVDTSKIVDQILLIFFQKYASLEYNNISKVFFDKKSYLKELINGTSEEEIDKSIAEYLKKNKPRKKRKANQEARS